MQGPKEGDARLGGIAGVTSFDELYMMLRSMQAYNGGHTDRGDYALLGSDGKRWTAEMIITEIEKAKRGEPSQLTRTGGLREKAQLLLAKERVTAEASVANKADFYRKWTPTVETYARNAGFNAPAHVTFALEILGRQLNYTGVPTESSILEALKQAQQAVKNAKPKS